MTISTRIRRWCARCAGATLSEMCPVCHLEICAQCGDGDECNEDGGGGAVDPIGWFIATTHSLLGHDTAARILGVPTGDKTVCLICRYERTRSEADRLAVIDALRPGQ